MARTKGSKNKKTALTTQEQINAVQEEISKLTEQLKSKKADLKKLEAAADEEKKQQLLEAVNQSGKTLDEVIELIKKN